MEWYEIRNPEKVSSPALLIYPERIEENIRRMIAVAGGTEFLRPHVKTHKMPEVIKLQLKHGITRFKCATIAEAEMTAACRAKDIMLAIQPVGPNIERFFDLRKKFTDTEITCIADDPEIIKALSAASTEYGFKTGVWLDLNVGMDRTGIVPGRKAEDLYNMIAGTKGLYASGLHAYDGHIHDQDLITRTRKCTEAFEPVEEMISHIRKNGKIEVVAGGTPTFPVHARFRKAQCSPGTLLLWDYGYSSAFTDMDYMHAAVLLTRVTSKPRADLLCLDLGHKAVASEMPQPRIKIMGLPEYQFTGHNEEHLVIKTPEAGKFRTGDHFYAIPWHICPTVDRHDRAVVVRNNEAVGEWEIVARKRKITI